MVYNGVYVRTGSEQMDIGHPANGLNHNHKRTNNAHLNGKPSSPSRYAPVVSSACP